MGARSGSQQGYAHGGDRSLRQVDDDGVKPSICPVAVRYGVGWLDAAVSQVGRNVDFHTVLLRIEVVLRVASCDQDASILYQESEFRL